MEAFRINVTFDYAVLKVRLVIFAVILSRQAQEAELHAAVVVYNWPVVLVLVLDELPRFLRSLRYLMAALELHVDVRQIAGYRGSVCVLPNLFAGNIQRFLPGVGEGRYGLISVTCSAFNDRTAHGEIVQDHGAAATTGDRCVRQLGTILRR